MKIHSTLAGLTLMITVLLTACEVPVGGPATPAAVMPQEEPSKPDEMMSDATPTADAMPQEANATPEAAMESPAWFGAALTDVRTGQTFTLNDFKGKVILVETMAVWCPKCYTQQTEIKKLHTLLGERDDFVSISLDIDPNEDSAILQNYIGQSGFDWMYAVAPADVAREIGLTYGDQFLNPPSTPILIVDRHGVAHPLPFGIKSADDLMQAIQPYLDESM